MTLVVGDHSPIASLFNCDIPYFVARLVTRGPSVSAELFVIDWKRARPIVQYIPVLSATLL